MQQTHLMCLPTLGYLLKGTLLMLAERRYAGFNLLSRMPQSPYFHNVGFHHSLIDKPLEHRCGHATLFEKCSARKLLAWHIVRCLTLGEVDKFEQQLLLLGSAAQRLQRLIQSLFRTIGWSYTHVHLTLGLIALPHGLIDGDSSPIEQ